MKRLKIYDIYLAEDIERIIKDICFIVVDNGVFAADMTDEYFQEIREDLLYIIDCTGYTRYDYLIEDV